VKPRANERLVYSTDRGRVCSGCGWPADNCQCSSRSGQTNAAVVYDLPQNAAFLKELCQELKRACGTGGAVVDDTIEVQGDLRDRVREILQRRGMVVKG